MNRPKREIGVLLALALASVVFQGGCAWRSYAYSRAIRQVTGDKMRTHTIVAANGTLAGYQVLEVKKLDNLVLDRIPPQVQKYIDDKIYGELKSSKLFAEVNREGYEFIIEDQTASATPKPTIVFEGAIDDYDPGYRGLRFIELGFNHSVVTIRFQLRDKQSGEILSSTSITAQNDTPTGSTKSGVNKIAKRIKKIVQAQVQGR
jgi:hypothetical protein